MVSLEEYWLHPRESVIKDERQHNKNLLLKYIPSLFQQENIKCILKGALSQSCNKYIAEVGDFIKEPYTIIWYEICEENKLIELYEDELIDKTTLLFNKGISMLYCNPCIIEIKYEISWWYIHTKKIINNESDYTIESIILDIPRIEYIIESMKNLQYYLIWLKSDSILLNTILKCLYRLKITESFAISVILPIEYSFIKNNQGSMLE